MIKHPKTQNNRQAGVSLLLSVLLISAIGIITFTVAGFVVQEIKSARSSTLTEPAIAAAETAGEQGIFLVKRNNNGFNTGCQSASYTDLGGGTSSGNIRIKKCVTSLPTLFQVSSAQPTIFYLYDPTNVNGNLCLERDAPCTATGLGSGPQLYGSILFKYISGSNNVRIQVETLDSVSVYDNSFGSGSRTVVLDPNIINSTDERIKVTLSTNLSSSTVEVSIPTGVYTGLPDYQTLDVEGCSALSNIANCDNTSQETYKRRLNITLPR